MTGFSPVAVRRPHLVFPDTDRYADLADDLVTGALDRLGKGLAGHVSLMADRDAGALDRDARHARDLLDGIAHGHPAAASGHALHGQDCLSHDLTSSWLERSYAIRRSRQRLNLRRLSSNELVTTETELKAIAVAAITGESRPDAANGMPITL